MSEKGIHDKLTELLSPEIAVMGFELIELDFSGGLLRLTIDKPGGVSMDDCVAVNRRVSLLLDTALLLFGAVDERALLRNFTGGTDRSARSAQLVHALLAR